VKKIRAAAALENGSTAGSIGYFPPQPHYPSAGQIPSPKNYSTSESGAAGRDRGGYAPVSRDHRDPHGRRVLPARGGSYPSAPHPAVHARHDQFYR